MMRINRLDKYTKTVLAVIALNVLALPVKAEEKVWYCDMLGFATTFTDGVKTFKEETFKIKVTPSEVIVGTGGFFNGQVMTIRRYTNSGIWYAQGLTYTAAFDNNILVFAQISSPGAIAISARCDDF